MLAEFSQTCIFHQVSERFLKLWCSHSKKSIPLNNLGIFTHAPIPHSKLQAEFFENLLHPTAERGGENYDFLYQNPIRKYEDDLEH